MKKRRERKGTMPRASWMARRWAIWSKRKRMRRMRKKRMRRKRMRRKRKKKKKKTAERAWM